MLWVAVIALYINTELTLIYYKYVKNTFSVNLNFGTSFKGGLFRFLVPLHASQLTI